MLVIWRQMCFQKEARDGFKVWIVKKNLRNTTKHLSLTMSLKTSHVRKLHLEKALHVIKVSCIEGGFVR